MLRKSVFQWARGRWPVLIAVTVGLATAMVASATAASRPRECTTCISRSPVYTKIWSHYQGMKSGDWRNCVYVSQQKVSSTWGCNRSVTVGASISGSVGNIPIPELKELLGFSVNWSYSETSGNSFSVTVRPGGHGWIQAGAIYKQYRVKTERRSCAEYGGCVDPKFQVNTVQRYEGQTYRYTGTDGTVHHH